MELLSTHLDCGFILCSIFSKGTQPFDYIKRNIIRKLAYEVKYTSQINGGLIICRLWFNKIF